MNITNTKSCNEGLEMGIATSVTSAPYILQAAQGQPQDQKQSLQTDGWPCYQSLLLCVRVIYCIQNPVQNNFSVRLDLSLIRCVFERSWRKGEMEESQCHSSLPKGQDRPAGCAAIQPDLDRRERNSGKFNKSKSCTSGRITPCTHAGEGLTC